jgi:hypothetical protein
MWVSDEKFCWSRRWHRLSGPVAFRRWINTLRAPCESGQGHQVGSRDLGADFRACRVGCSLQHLCAESMRLAKCRAALRIAGISQGQVVLLSGEAGIALAHDLVALAESKATSTVVRAAVARLAVCPERPSRGRGLACPRRSALDAPVRLWKDTDVGPFGTRPWMWGIGSEAWGSASMRPPSATARSTRMSCPS